MLYTVREVFPKDVLPVFEAVQLKLGNRFKITTEEDPLDDRHSSHLYGYVRVTITSDEYSFTPFWDEARAINKDI